MARPDNRRRCYAAIGTLLQYPEAGFLRLLPALRETARTLSAEVQQDFEAFAEWMESTPLLTAQGHYVDVFDRKRRACLYLSYYLNGDTRRRGMAIVRFKELYRAFGWDASEAELPDFLPTLLQFCAVSDVQAGEAVLAGHRAGLEVLHQALVDARSPYRHLVAVLLEFVPEGPDASMAQQLIETGPPTEQVGLEPFATPDMIGAGTP